MLSYRRSLVWPPGYIFQASLVVISYPPFLSSFFLSKRSLLRYMQLLYVYMDM